MIERLKNLRIDNDDTQRSLAKKIGYHHIQIAKYETGINTPPVSYIIEICKIYNVSADYILGLPKGLNWPR